ncbi:MAG: 3-deoxy-manno-octulosonate cytidylyltransferase [Saprospiraceae bacterium]
MSTLGIIPARYASTRFPGKPLANINGKSMLQRVYERAQLAKLLDAVIIATDDYRIFDHAMSFQANVIMTDPNHPSGTDRCAEVATLLNNYDIVVNIQGDEPFIEPASIDLVIELLQNGAPIATLAKQIDTHADLVNPNVVKVTFDENRKALDFSRQPIPVVNNVSLHQALKNGVFYKHIGLYGFQRATLLEITRLPQGEREKAASLEQLRWLDAGYPIFVNFTQAKTVSIDTPEDLTKVRSLA